MGKRTEQEQAEQTIDALTLRFFTMAMVPRFAAGYGSASDNVTKAAQLLEAVKEKERELGIGIRIDG